MVESSSSSHDDSSNTEHSPPSFTIYVVTILLAVNVSSLLIGRARQSLGIEFLPYTLLVFSTGLGLGFISQVLDAHEDENGGDDGDVFSSRHWGDQTTPVLYLFRALSAARTVDPDLVMLVLLPPLIYTAASHANWHTFKKSFKAILALAFPAVGFSTVAIAYLFKMLPHTGPWSFSQALTLGAILAATDPVAVVAALHELGAPPKLDMLIDGESLVNDGSAMVFFLIFNDLGFEGHDIGVAEGCYRFVRLALGGPLFGALMFGVLWMWLDYHVSSAGEAMISVMTAYYATFFLAEKLLRVSGVLAVVVLGLGMARKGKWAVPPSAAKGLELLNENFASLAESTIFFLAGLVTYKAMHFMFRTISNNEEDHSDGHEASTNEWAPGGEGAAKQGGVLLDASPGELVLNLVLVYVIIHVVRFAGIFLASPVLRHSGYRFSWQELGVCWFGGLRGAVGLALAMEVVNESRHAKHTGDDDEDSSSGDQEVITLVRQELLFYVAGIVILTLVVNGTLIGHVYRMLNPYPESAHETELRRLGILKTAESVEHTCSAPNWVASHSEELGWELRRSDCATVLKLVPAAVDVHMKASGEFTLLGEMGRPLHIDVLRVVLHDVIADKARQNKPLIKKAAHAIIASHRMNRGLLLAAAAANASKSLSPIQSLEVDEGEGGGGSGDHEEEEQREREREEEHQHRLTAAAAASAAGVADFDTEHMLNAVWGKVMALARVRRKQVEAIFTPDGKGGLGPGGVKGDLGVALVDVGKGLKKLGVSLTKEELELWFAGCDKSGDGMLSLNEFNASAEERRLAGVAGATSAATANKEKFVSSWESIVASIGSDPDHASAGGGGVLSPVGGRGGLEEEKRGEGEDEKTKARGGGSSSSFPFDRSSSAEARGSSSPLGTILRIGSRLGPSSSSSFSAMPWSPGGAHPADDDGLSSGEKARATETLRESALKASWNQGDDTSDDERGIGATFQSSDVVAIRRRRGSELDEDEDDDDEEDSVRQFNSGHLGHMSQRKLGIGAMVKVVKQGSSKYGLSGTVIDPDWHGRIKVLLQGDQEKSYVRSDLMALQDWQQLSSSSAAAGWGSFKQGRVGGGGGSFRVDAVGSFEEGMDEDDFDAAFDIKQRYHRTLTAIRLHSVGAAGKGGGGVGGSTSGRSKAGARSAHGILKQLTNRQNYVLIHDRGSVGRIFGMINELYEELYQHKQLVDVAMCSLVDATTAGEEYIEVELSKLHEVHQEFGGAQAFNGSKSMDVIRFSRRSSSSPTPYYTNWWWCCCRAAVSACSAIASFLVHEDEPPSYSVEDVNKAKRGGSSSNAGPSSAAAAGQAAPSASAAGYGGVDDDEEAGTAAAATGRSRSFKGQSSSSAASPVVSFGEDTVGGEGIHSSFVVSPLSNAHSVPASAPAASHQAARELTIGGALEKELNVLLAGLPQPRTRAKRRLYIAVPFLRPLIRFLAFRDIYYTVMILTAFIKAHRDLPRMLTSKGLLRESALRRVKKSCAAVNHRAFEHLRMLAIDFPVAVHVTRVVLFALDLNHAKNLEVMKLHEQGFLDHHQAANFVEPFHRTMHALHFCVDAFAMHRLVIDYDAKLPEQQKRNSLAAASSPAGKGPSEAVGGHVRWGGDGDDDAEDKEEEVEEEEDLEGGDVRKSSSSRSRDDGNSRLAGRALAGRGNDDEGNAAAVALMASIADEEKSNARESNDDEEEEDDLICSKMVEDFKGVSSSPSKGGAKEGDGGEQKKEGFAQKVWSLQDQLSAVPDASAPATAAPAEGFKGGRGGGGRGRGEGCGGRGRGRGEGRGRGGRGEGRGSTGGAGGGGRGGGRHSLSIDRPDSGVGV